MPRRAFIGRIFDARRDRFDAKDYEYRAPLKSLPHVFPPPERIARYLPLYARDGMLLDQRTDGSCTGFGLACVVNYLRWEADLVDAAARGGKAPPPSPRVSPRMLYRNAQLYDEYPGEDYSGSSCRGAMKGFSKHGVCDEDHWPAFAAGGAPGLARPGWEVDAARRPLGAYYRIDARSLVDMQAAIHEIHAIYVSASVHAGWALNGATAAPSRGKRRTGARRCAYKSIDEALIAPAPDDVRGGHAFAMVGYTRAGFIVQNSWGPDWGYEGFAILPYDDWLENGCDAWALALGVPVERARSPGYRSTLSLQQRAMAAATPARSRAAPPAATNAVDEPAPPLWSDGEENEHVVLLSANGRPERTLVTAASGEETLRRVVHDIPKSAGARDIVIFIHGGLNSRDEAMRRCRRLGPWFAANGIHPIFLAWRTGVLETIQSMLRGHEDGKAPAAPRGLGGGVVDAASELRDLTFQPLARMIARPAWEDMKTRAGYACDETGAASAACALLRGLAEKTGARVHLVAHSAGALIVGRLLRLAKGRRPDFDSAHLWAPACPAGFAVEAFSKAFAAKAVDPGRVFFGRLSDANERADACLPGFYGKSLLYLVSRALERDHKTPILGLARAWPGARELRDEVDMDMFNMAFRGDLLAWSKLVADAGMKPDPPIAAERVRTRDWRGDILDIGADHGSFDNNLDVVNLAIARMLRLAPGAPPKRRVSDLTGY